MAILRLVLPHAEHLADRRRLRIAERQRADPLGRRQVALEQHRRDAQHVGVVVEPAARIVGRQHRRDVDVEREQIAHGVRVLGAIQAMGQRTAGIRIARARRRSSVARARRRAPSRGRRQAAAAPAGGIMPARTFRMTFSQTSACAATFDRSGASSASSPVFSRWLWQVTQYLSMVARLSDAAADDEVEASADQEPPGRAIRRRPSTGWPPSRQRLRSRANGDGQGHHASATRNCNVIPLH